MTTVLAVQGNGWAVIGWDSRVADVDGRIYEAHKSWNKVVRNNGWLLGAAGDVRAINILHHCFVPSKPDKALRGVRLDKFVTGVFIPELREVFEREGYTGASRYGKPEEHGSELIAAVNGVVYEIGNDWAWVRDDSGVYGVGSGSAYGIGALAMCDTTNEPSARRYIEEALNVAARYDSATGNPFHVLTQMANT